VTKLSVFSRQLSVVQPSAISRQLSACKPPVGGAPTTESSEKSKPVILSEAKDFGICSFNELLRSFVACAPQDDRHMRF
jgi:hypothetical protein